MKTISQKDFQNLQQLIHLRFGIVLNDKKKALMIARLSKILRRYGLTNFNELYQLILKDTTGQALSLLADQISTNHTFFYREKEHFDFMIQHALPEILKQQEANLRQEIRIWSAGCSSGEEPYTIALFLNEFLEHHPIRGFAGILGTDVSSRVLKIAHTGIYAKEDVAHLPAKYRTKYFNKLPDNLWQVKPVLKKLVLFRRLNLIRPSYPFKHQFHIIFCRNVMIYFDPQERLRLLQKFSQHMVPGGFLFLGHSESLDKQNPYFQYIHPAIYQKRNEDSIQQSPNSS